jgi:bifunctional non-homologous end joining protein LigD
MLRMRARLTGFIEPCLPSPAPNPPAGDGWIHEIKLDGFRLLARRDAAGVRLLTRRGIDWTTRYPSIAAAVAALACRSCLIDGEVVICGEDGIPVFDRLRYGRQPQAEAVLFAFDLLELAGKDLRRTPLEERKGTLAKLVRKSSWAVQLNETSPSAATSFSATPASSALKVSCRSGSARPMSPAAHGTGSRAKIRQHRR